MRMTRHAGTVLAGAAMLLLAHGCTPAASGDAAASNGGLALALANDNRTPAGTRSRGVLSIHLEARLAAWRPDLDVDTAVTVQAFAEVGGAPQIPGPLLRTQEGTELRISVRNALPDSTLIVHGLRAGFGVEDTLHVPVGETREVRFRAGAPGTYLYWGTTSGRSMETRSGRDALLTGAIVVDPLGVPPHPEERIFVLNLIDILPDTAQRPPTVEDIWEVTINGRSWPHTERLTYPVGDTIRWRWINGTDRSHPMHLHGFHFRALAKGDGHTDTTYAAGTERLAVTELMEPGSTFRMDWVPTRAGRWLMHCHMTGHIVPFPERPDSLRAHDLHDLAQHPLAGMAGLVLGITTVDARTTAAPAVQPSRRLRLFVQESATDGGGLAAQGYALPGGADATAGSISVPGPPLVLTRGETTAITVVNRLSEPTTVHWHGMELESVFDGVSGWSATAGNLAPLLAPGDSFTVAFTPPRAGTFIYHSHMDESSQVERGAYGALLVLEPGERFDPATDLVLMIGGAVDDGVGGPALNGRRSPPPLELRVGTRYRLRIVNILPVVPVTIELDANAAAMSWTALAKDGATLPPSRRTGMPARLKLGVGETIDFEWTPNAPLEGVLRVVLPEEEPEALEQRIRVRP